MNVLKVTAEHFSNTLLEFLSVAEFWIIRN